MIKTISKVANFSNAISEMIVSVESYFARRATYKRTYNELSALSERELWDLGFSRSDIPAIARKASEAA